MTTRRFAVTALAALAAASVLAACSSGGAAPSATSPAPTAAATPGAAAGTTHTSRTASIVPAPGGGNIHQHVPSGTRHTKAPIALNHTASFGTGVSARIVRHTTVDAKGHGPGEISGPATAITLVLVNRGHRAVDISNVIVNDVDAAGTPLIPMSGPPAHALGGMLQPGSSARGTYVFSLHGTLHNPFTISISYSTAAPVVQLTGALS